MNKSKVTSSFRGILYGLYFLAPSIFLLLSIGRRSTLAKIWGAGGAGGGGCDPPPPPQPRGFYGPACINTQRDVTDLVNHAMVKNTKT